MRTPGAECSICNKKPERGEITIDFVCGCLPYVHKACWEKKRRQRLSYLDFYYCTKCDREYRQATLPTLNEQDLQRVKRVEMISIAIIFSMYLCFVLCGIVICYVIGLACFHYMEGIAIPEIRDTLVIFNRNVLAFDYISSSFWVGLRVMTLALCNVIAFTYIFGEFTRTEFRDNAFFGIIVLLLICYVSLAELINGIFPESSIKFDIELPDTVQFFIRSSLVFGTFFYLPMFYLYDVIVFLYKSAYYKIAFEKYCKKDEPALLEKILRRELEYETMKRGGSVLVVNQ